MQTCNAKRNGFEGGTLQASAPGYLQGRKKTIKRKHMEKNYYAERHVYRTARKIAHALCRISKLISSTARREQTRSDASMARYEIDQRYLLKCVYGKISKDMNVTLRCSMERFRNGLIIDVYDAYMERCRNISFSDMLRCFYGKMSRGRY